MGQFVSKTFKKLHLDIGFSWVVSFRVDGRRGLLSPTLRTCPFDIWIGRYGITVGFDTECKSSIARCIFRYPIFCQVNSEFEFRMLPPMKRYLIQQNLIKLYQKVIVDILRLLKVSVAVDLPIYSFGTEFKSTQSIKKYKVVTKCTKCRVGSSFRDSKLLMLHCRELSQSYAV